MSEAKASASALAAALDAHDRGESIIATNHAKKPWYAWKEYQTTAATRDKLETWARDPACTGFAVVAGEVSQLVILDFDGEDGIKLCERLGLDPHVRTPSGGCHVRFGWPGFYVKTMNSRTAKALQQRWSGLDIRADGGYAVEFGGNGQGDYVALRDLADLENLGRLPRELRVDLGIEKDGAPELPEAPDVPDPRHKVTKPGRHAHLLGIGGAMVSRGESEAAILKELRRVNKADCEPPKPDEKVVALAKDLAERYDPNPDEEQFSELLTLGTVGVRPVAFRMYGQGASASLDVELDNGETMRFDSLRDMVRPQTLMAELVACTGATPQLKQPQAMRAVSLARKLAQRVLTATEDDIATDWAIEYLQAAETIEFELQNQTNRYRAFELLANREPYTHARDTGVSYASATIVLRDLSGDRLVRSGWFLRHVRELTARETPSTLAGRMKRVGWEQRGHRGRIKARPPGRDGELVWPFWVVPADWGDDE